MRERYATKNVSEELKDKMSAVEIEMLHVIDYEYFKKGLVRIAALAQNKLIFDDQNNEDKNKT